MRNNNWLIITLQVALIVKKKFIIINYYIFNIHSIMFPKNFQYLSNLQVLSYHFIIAGTFNFIEILIRLVEKGRAQDLKLFRMSLNLVKNFHQYSSENSRDKKTYYQATFSKNYFSLSRFKRPEPYCIAFTLNLI